ncbi:MAG: AAA family ATPase [Opitutales bacterium]
MSESPPTQPSPAPATGDLLEMLLRVRAEIGKVILGQDRVIEAALITLLTRGHALIEGVPGVAKTLLVRTLGKVLDCPEGRIQFTPDLMPSDVTGTNIFNMKTQAFELLKGPIFTTFLLADEINRAPAKTQAALLQAMQERHVSIDNDLLPLDEDFTVFATQNPIEYEGTFPLPEAQKDRFLLKIQMGYPDAETELALAHSILAGESPEQRLESGQVQPIVQKSDLARLRAQVAAVSMRPELVDYAVKAVRQTRDHDSLLVGAGPRATQALIAASRARAALQERDFVIPDDIQALATPVLEHRLLLQPEYEIEGLSVSEVVEQIFREIPVPR